MCSSDLMGINGIGRLTFEAVTSRDYDVILATTVIFAVAFVVGSLMSATGLAIGGELPRHQIVFALAMLPAVGAGFALSHLIAPRVRREHLRRAVLTLAMVAGFAAILRGLL